MGVKTFFHKALSVALIAAISFEVVTANIHLSAEDATKVKQFCADFGELANIVAETGAFSSSANEYKSEATDDAVNAWINERFSLRYGRESATSMEKAFLGQSSEDIDSGDSWGGNSYWTITKDGWLKRKATATGDQMLRKWDTLVVKGASGSAAILKNFETSFTVNQNFSERISGNKAGRGAVTLFFRQSAVDATVKSSNQAAVVIGKGGDDWNTETKTIGVSVLSGSEIIDSSNDIYKNTITSIDKLDSVEQFRVVVRAVGKDCEVSITSPEGSVVYYNQSYTLSVEDYGYISFGITNSTRSIGNITLTELNEQGEAVDFSADNTDAAPMFFSIRDLVPYNGGYTVNWGNTTKTAWYPFYSEWNDQANIFRHFIADTFNTYNNYGTVYYSLSWDAMTNVHDCFGSASANQWLQCYQKETDSRTLGRITSLVYKDSDTGDEVIYKNFRTKLFFRFEGNNGGLVLGFRQNRAGKFLDGDGVLNQKQGIVAITKTGITVASGKQIGDVPIDGTQTDFGFTLPQEIGVSLKLVGNVLNIQISDSAGVILFSQAYKEAVTEAEMQAVYKKISTPRKLGAVIKWEDFYTDSPTVFKKDGIFYMYFIAIAKDCSISGYETHLAKSDDLIHWEYCGAIFKRNELNRWDSKQCAGYAAFPDINFDGTGELNKINGSYYISYLAGNSDGYEPDPLYMGLAKSTDPTNPDGFTRFPEPILKPDDADSRELERQTLYKSFLFEDELGVTGYKYVNAYNGKAHDSTERIFLAVSNDGESWERYGDRPVIDLITGDPRGRICGDPQIILIDDIYVMFFFRCRDGESAFNTFACSRDLVNWTHWNGEPLIKSEYEWENVHAHKTWFVRSNEINYHFYCAVNDKNERFIALATSK